MFTYDGSIASHIIVLVANSNLPLWDSTDEGIRSTKPGGREEERSFSERVNERMSGTERRLLRERLQRAARWEALGLGGAPGDWG